MSSQLLPVTCALCLLAGCSSAPQGAVPGNVHHIHRVIAQNIQVRRPAGPGADPAAELGDPDYTSKPLPNTRLDCEPVDAIFKSIDLTKLRTCLLELQNGKKPTTLFYRLRRKPVPYLEMTDAEKAPRCLLEALKTIPVPREIFFQSNEEGRLACYAARVDVDQPDLFGWELPLKKLALKLQFPAPVVPKNDQETLGTLAVWSITPFWTPDGHDLPSKVVPEALCAKCFGGPSKLARPWNQPPEWPDSGDTP